VHHDPQAGRQARGPRPDPGRRPRRAGAEEIRASRQGAKAQRKTKRTFFLVFLCALAPWREALRVCRRSVTTRVAGLTPRPAPGHNTRYYPRSEPQRRRTAAGSDEPKESSGMGRISGWCWAAAVLVVAGGARPAWAEGDLDLAAAEKLL